MESLWKAGAGGARDRDRTTPGDTSPVDRSNPEVKAPCLSRRTEAADVLARLHLDDPPRCCRLQPVARGQAQRPRASAGAGRRARRVRRRDTPDTGAVEPSAPEAPRPADPHTGREPRDRSRMSESDLPEPLMAHTADGRRAWIVGYEAHEACGGRRAERNPPTRRWRCSASRTTSPRGGRRRRGVRGRREGCRVRLSKRTNGVSRAIDRAARQGRREVTRPGRRAVSGSCIVEEPRRPRAAPATGLRRRPPHATRLLPLPRSREDLRPRRGTLLSSAICASREHERGRFTRSRRPRCPQRGDGAGQVSTYRGRGSGAGLRLGENILPRCPPTDPPRVPSHAAPLRSSCPRMSPSAARRPLRASRRSVSLGGSLHRRSRRDWRKG